jgi:hypothetical protein
MQHKFFKRWLSVRSAKKFPRLLLNPKVHYSVHNTISLFPILSQINPVYALTSYSFNTYFNITLPSTPRSPVWYLLFTLPGQKFVWISHFLHARLYSSHFTLLYITTLLICWRVQKINLLITQHYPVSIQAYVFWMVSFLRVFSPKFGTYFPLPSSVLHNISWSRIQNRHFKRTG